MSSAVHPHNFDLRDHSTRPEMRTGEVDAQTGLTLVTLPQPQQTLNSQQTSLTQKVLDSLGSGLDVGVSRSVVYSHRHGDAKAFWSLSKFDCSAQPQEVAKLEPQALFVFQDFAKGERPLFTHFTSYSL